MSLVVSKIFNPVMHLCRLSQEAKKKYDKETEKYCAVLEKHLSLSAKKKESHLHEVSRAGCGCALIFLIVLSCFKILKLYFAGGQSGGQCTAAFLRGFSRVCLQSPGSPGKEDV